MATGQSNSAVQGGCWPNPFAVERQECLESAVEMVAGAVEAVELVGEQVVADSGLAIVIFDDVVMAMANGMREIDGDVVESAISCDAEF